MAFEFEVGDKVYLKEGTQFYHQAPDGRIGTVVDTRRHTWIRVRWEAPIEWTEDVYPSNDLILFHREETEVIDETEETEEGEDIMENSIVQVGQSVLIREGSSYYTQAPGVVGKIRELRDGGWARVRWSEDNHVREDSYPITSLWIIEECDESSPIEVGDKVIISSESTYEYQAKGTIGTIKATRGETFSVAWENNVDKTYRYRRSDFHKVMFVDTESQSEEKKLVPGQIIIFRNGKEGIILPTDSEVRKLIKNKWIKKESLEYRRSLPVLIKGSNLVTSAFRTDFKEVTEEFEDLVAYVVNSTYQVVTKNERTNKQIKIAIREGYLINYMGEYTKETARELYNLCNN